MEFLKLFVGILIMLCIMFTAVSIMGLTLMAALTTHWGFGLLFLFEITLFITTVTWFLSEP